MLRVSEGSTVHIRAVTSDVGLCQRLRERKAVNGQAAARATVDANSRPRGKNGHKTAVVCMYFCLWL